MGIWSRPSKTNLCFKVGDDIPSGDCADKLGFIPRFPPGCRRITPGDAFLEAIQKPNAELIPKSIIAVTEDGLIDEDGNERKVDTIICATGRCDREP